MAKQKTTKNSKYEITQEKIGVFFVIRFGWGKEEVLEKAEDYIKRID